MMKKELFKYKGFEGSMDFSPEDECLIGEVLFINSKITYVGETYPELKSAFEDAVDAYLEHCEKHNIKPEKSYSGTLNVRIGSELHKNAVRASQEYDISVNEVIKRALENYLHQDIPHKQMKIEKTSVTYSKEQITFSAKATRKAC